MLLSYFQLSLGDSNLITLFPKASCSIGLQNYHRSCNNETPCLGSSILIMAFPSTIFTHSGEVNNFNCPDFSSSAICSDPGFCGDPIFFHTVYELLNSWSIR